MHPTKMRQFGWLIPFFVWTFATDALSQSDPSTAAAPESSATPNKKAEAQKTLTYAKRVD
jgi:hypothetical protein